MKWQTVRQHETDYYFLLEGSCEDFYTFEEFGLILDAVKAYGAVYSEDNSEGCWDYEVRPLRFTFKRADEAILFKLRYGCE